MLLALCLLVVVVGTGQTYLARTELVPPMMTSHHIFTGEHAQD